MTLWWVIFGLGVVGLFPLSQRCFNLWGKPIDSTLG